MAMGCGRWEKVRRKGWKTDRGGRGRPFGKTTKSTHFYSPLQRVLPGLNSFLQFRRGIKERNEAC